MKILWTRILIIIVVFGFMSACVVQTIEPAPTATHTTAPTDTKLPTATEIPTDTPEPTPTRTSTPTETPLPTETATPTIEPTLEMGEVQELALGGFSIRPVVGYGMETEFNTVIVSDQGGTFFITISGVTDYNGSQSHEEIVEEYLVELEGYGIGEFNLGESDPIIVDDVEGMVFDVTGIMLDAEIEGQSILVMPSENHFLFGLAVGNLSTDEDVWQEIGSEVFNALIESIEFIEAGDIDGSACQVSADETYGYSEDNPIKVGGDWLDGPGREKAYLNSLSGPNGEAVSFERLGSFNYGDTILDEYEVQFAGKSVILFLDEYNYEQPATPVGFICWTPIPCGSP